MFIKRTELTGCLERSGFAVAILELGRELTLVATTAGGRIFGPFLGETDLLGWTPALDDLDRALGDGRWNIGGERVWLAPERAFNFSDPAAILETYRVDPSLDPGVWQLSCDERGLALESEMIVPRSDGGTPVNVSLTRSILPLRVAGSAIEGVVHGAYRQSITVRRGPQGNGIPVVPWLIRQVSLGGLVRISATPDAMGRTVFGEAPAEAVCPGACEWRVEFGPRGFFKTSYSRDALGPDGLSYTVSRGGQATALQYCPMLADSGSYPEALPSDPASLGQAAALFRDDGRFGAYGELELYGHRLGPEDGQLATDIHLLHGEESAVSEARSRQATEISSIPIS